MSVDFISPDDAGHQQMGKRHYYYGKSSNLHHVASSANGVHYTSVDRPALHQKNYSFQLRGNRGVDASLPDHRGSILLDRGQLLVGPILLLLFFGWYLHYIIFRVPHETKTIRRKLKQMDTDHKRKHGYQATSCPYCLEEFVFCSPAAESTALVANSNRMGSDGCPVKILQCGHVFDQSCWQRIARSSSQQQTPCPICYKPQNDKQSGEAPRKKRVSRKKQHYRGSSCPICLEDFKLPPELEHLPESYSSKLKFLPTVGSDGRPLIVLSCHHAFDQTCWKKLPSKSRCPICRQSVKSVQVLVCNFLTGEGVIEADYHQERKYRLTRLQESYPFHHGKNLFAIEKWSREQFNGSMYDDFCERERLWRSQE